MSRRVKKLKAQHDTKPKEVKCIKLSRQKHIKRTSLINSLFTYASTLPSKITVSTLWENHKQINDIVAQLIQIESELKTPLPRRNKTTVAELEKWATENGATMNNVSIAEFPGFDFGLQAVDVVKQGSIVISVPKKLMITVDCIKGSPMENLYREDVVLQQLPNVALAVFLLVEKFRTDKPSFWFPYFSALPSSYSTCVYFSMDDLNELKGSPALEYSLKMCKNIARQYAYFWNIFQKNTDEASNILRDIFTYEQYRWAVSTIMTRQNYIPCADEIPVNVIIPLWDFCNHANNKEKSDTQVSTTYGVGSQCCVCVAPRDFAPGEQINIFYGERSNADFLVHNGFVYEDNHHDTLKIKFGISNSEAYMLRLALLRKLKLPPCGEYLIKCDPNDAIHSSALAFLRIFKMTEEQLNDWMEKDVDTVEDCLLGPIGSMDTQFDTEVLLYMQTRLNILQKAYPTTLQEDEQILKEEMLAPIRRLVITQRLTEKRILQSAIAYCSEKILELKLAKTHIRNDS